MPWACFRQLSWNSYRFFMHSSVISSIWTVLYSCCHFKQPGHLTDRKQTVSKNLTDVHFHVVDYLKCLFASRTSAHEVVDAGPARPDQRPGCTHHGRPHPGAGTSQSACSSAPLTQASRPVQERLALQRPNPQRGPQTLQQAPLPLTSRAVQRRGLYGKWYGEPQAPTSPAEGQRLLASRRVLSVWQWRALGRQPDPSHRLSGQWSHCAAARSHQQRCEEADVLRDHVSHDEARRGPQAGSRSQRR